MTETVDAEIISPAQWAARPKRDEDNVLHDLGEQDGRMAIAICERIAIEIQAVGVIAAEIVGRDAHAASCQFHRWKVRSKSLASLYARARESRADLMAGEVVDLAYAPFAATTPLEMRAEVEARRLKMDALKWAAGKFARNLYGDDPPPTSPVNVQVNVADNGPALIAEIERSLAKRAKALARNPARDGE